MKKNKTLTAILLTILLTVVFIAVGYFTNIYGSLKFSSNDDMKSKGIVQSLRHLDEHISMVQEGFKRKTTISVELMTMALQHFITDDVYNGPEVFEDGFVFRLENGKIVYPENSSVVFTKLNDVDRLRNLPPFSQETISENGAERDVLITVKEISGNLYYVDWAEMDDYLAVGQTPTYIKESIFTMENVYNSGVILLDEEDPSRDPIYISDSLANSEVGTDSELRREILSKKSAKVSIENTKYKSYSESLKFLNQKVKALVLVNTQDNNVHLYISIGITVAFIFLGSLALILFNLVDPVIPDESLTEKQKKGFHLDSISSKIITVIVTNTLLLFILLIGYQLFANLTCFSNMNQEALNMIANRIENSSRQDAVYREDEETWDLFCAHRVGMLYAEYPELQTRDFLVKVNQIIGSEYIMTFDKNGNELMSSNPYIGFRLGKEIPSTKEFRYLLQGVDHIVLDPEQDQFLGKKVQMIGARMDLRDNDGYCAVIFAFDPQKTWESNIQHEITDYITRITPKENLSIIADSETKQVHYSSSPELSGKVMDEIGLADFDTAIPTSLASLEIYGQKYYGAFSPKDLYFYFYMIQSTSIWDGVLVFSVYAAVAYLVISLIIWRVVGNPSEGKTLAEKRGEKELSKDGDLSNSGKKFSLESYIAENKFKKVTVSEWWKQLKSGEKLMFVIRVLLAALLIVGLILLFGPFGADLRAVFEFVLEGNWKRGVNEMALTAIITVIFILVIFIFLKNFLVKALCKVLNAKNETIVRLVASLLHYIAIISAIFVCLSYLGINTQTLVTSASILTLAISLGSKDLVADILAGICIIFEGDFQVGDIIDVNGFKGRVFDIGVRSTKLIDSSRNIKIIDNQSVKNVLNMSKEITKMTIILPVSHRGTCEKIEEMLNRELPEIGKQIPTIISGPTYDGVDSIDFCMINIKISAECRQNDLGKTKLRLNQALWDLFTSNGYTI